MRRLDKLILMELAGPWAFGVGMFTVLIMAGTYLFKITDYIVSGVSISVIAEFTLLLLPGIMVKTFSMAVLLASLLAFGRLSSDSEIVAVKAAGASLPRIMLPVALFGLVVAVLAFVVNERVVAAASHQAEALKKQIEKDITGGRQWVSDAIFQDKKLRALFIARDFNLKERSMKDVTIKTYDGAGHPTAFIDAPSMTYTDEKHWKLGAGARLFEYSGQHILQLGNTYPSSFAQPPDPDGVAASQVKDLDVYNMAQMKILIAQKRGDPSFDPSQLANLEFGYYNKIALPLATIIFGLVGAPLGIRSHRTGAATGFWLSVLIIFAYMMLANLMNTIATGGAIPPIVASFTPLVIGLVFSLVLIIRKNT